MNVTVNIFGAGVVTGAGQHPLGSRVWLEATPASSNIFKWFILDGNKILSNPYFFDATSADVELDCLFETPFENYILGMVPFLLPEVAINNIRTKRGVLFQQGVETISSEILELSYADALIYGSTMPQSVTGTKDSDGSWSHSEGTVAISNSDKSFYRSMALNIYKKYGEISACPSGLRFENLNGTPYKL